MNYTYIFLTCNTDLHNFRIKKKESRLRGGGVGQTDPWGGQAGPWGGRPPPPTGPNDVPVCNNLPDMTQTNTP